MKFSVARRFLRACESTANRSPDTSVTGLYAYDLRDCDDCFGDPCEVKSFVLVNHWGTVIVKEPIEGADDGVMLDDDDPTGCRTVSPKGAARMPRQQSETGYNYLGENMTLEEFANSAPKMEQTM